MIFIFICLAWQPFRLISVVIVWLLGIMRVLSIIWLFPSFIYDCYNWMLQILSSTLNVCVSPWFLLFNLTPSVTGTTGRYGCKTLRFYQLIWLVTGCPSLLALKYKENVLFRALICVFRQPLRLVVLVIICYFKSLSAFLGCFLCLTSP